MRIINKEGASGKDIVIPEKIGPFYIETIGTEFQGKTDIKSITIPI